MKKIIFLFSVLILGITSCTAGTITVDSTIMERQAKALERIADKLDLLIVAIDSNTAQGEMIVIPQVSYTLTTSSPIPVVIIGDYDVVYSSK